MPVTSTSSPGSMRAPTKQRATRLMLSVVPRVKTISSRLPAAQLVMHSSISALAMSRVVTPVPSRKLSSNSASCMQGPVCANGALITSFSRAST